MTWDNYFMSVATAVSMRSKDPSTTVGAIIVGGEDNETISTGYNNFPRGVIDSPSRYKDRKTKLLFAAHAEENAIVQAARTGAHTKGCTIYVTSLPPCATCARMIINAGIARVVYALPMDEVPERWRESTEAAMTMFREAGVKADLLR